MKKLISMLMCLILVFAFVGCSPAEQTPDIEGKVENPGVDVENNETDSEQPDVQAQAVMSYEEYAAAEIDSAVVIDAYVQGKQSWYEDKATIYTQDEEGAYFIYEMACSEEDYEKLVPGTHIKVYGYKAEWSGEIEIVDATFEIIDGSYIAEPFDATSLLGTEELINHQNKLVAFNGLTVENIEYKNQEPGDDIYLTLGLDGASYSFCVEIYLTGADSEVYTTVGNLNVGDKVNVEAFLYWYEGANPHITSISVAQ